MKGNRNLTLLTAGLENKHNHIKIASYLSEAVLELSEIEVNLKPKEYFSGDTNAIFHPETYSICLNEDWILKSEISEIYGVVFHEYRHAYQRAQIEYGEYFIQKEPKAIKEIWSKEFSEYTKPQHNIEVDRTYAFRNVEIDAIAFSNLMLKQLFEANLWLPDDVKTEVARREEELIASGLLMKIQQTFDGEGE